MGSESPHASLAVARLDTNLVGSRILVYESVDSTNERALQVGGDGTVIVADRQSAGRGRHGRIWHSKPGVGLWFSVAFEGDQEGAAFAAPLAIRNAFKPLCTIKIKWPNDVLVDGKKLGGILVERRHGHTVLGVGLNINHTEADFPADLQEKATSLRLVTGRPHDRASLLRDILSELDNLVMIIRSGGLDVVHREWSESCAIRGKQIRFQDFEGIVTGIDQSGGLRVAAEDGEHRVVFGEIIQLEET